MDLAGYVINAVLVEGRSVKEVCEAHGISRSWLYELIGSLPRTRRRGARGRSRSGPARRRRGCRRRSRKRSSRCVRSSTDLGVDAGAAHDPATTCCAVDRRRPDGGAVGGHDLAGAVPTGLRHPPAPQAAQELLAALPGRAAQRVLAGRHHPLGARRWHRRGDPQRHRRPLPPRWSPPGPSSPPRPPTWSRPSTSAPPSCGCPASMLTDNGAIFTAESRNGACAIELELLALGVDYKHSRPYHPQTCGKVERFHQTLKKWLAKQPPARHRRRAAGPARPLPRLLQPASDPTGPSTGAPRPRPSPPAPRPPRADAGITVPAQHRVRRDRIDSGRQGHPALPLQAPAPRHRPPLRRHPRHAPRRRPRRARHQRRRRAHSPSSPSTRPRHYQHPETTRTTCLSVVRDVTQTPVRDVSRHHTVELEGIEPSSTGRVTVRATTVPEFEAVRLPHRRVGWRSWRPTAGAFSEVSGLSRRQRSFPRSSPASVAGLRWIGPVRPLLVAVSLSSPERSGGESELAVGVCVGAPFSESEQLGSHVRLPVPTSKPISPVICLFRIPSSIPS